MSCVKGECVDVHVLQGNVYMYMKIPFNYNSLSCEQPLRCRYQSVTHCAGHVLANARPHRLYDVVTGSVCITHHVRITQTAGLNPQSSRVQAAEDCCIPSKKLAILNFNKTKNRRYRTTLLYSVTIFRCASSTQQNKTAIFHHTPITTLVKYM